ncbi:MAG: HAD-IIIA family hydrolase [Rhizobacter sp.]|nr:HAD-IIIA family hydrolase [Chlorobiales bacterium]
MRDLLKEIKILIFDLDGVLTDGRITYSESGDELKSFHARDGFAIKEALVRGLKIAVVSTRPSKAAARWLGELSDVELHLGVKDKFETYGQVKLSHGLTDAECAYMGDDISDLPALEAAGFSATPIDGHEYLRSRVAYISGYEGGKGCVRELIEMVLAEQGKWKYFVET